MSFDAYIRPVAGSFASQLPETEEHLMMIWRGWYLDFPLSFLVDSWISLYPFWLIPGFSSILSGWSLDFPLSFLVGTWISLYPFWLLPGFPSILSVRSPPTLILSP